MGSFVENYTSDVLCTFTDKEREQLKMLHQQLDKKFEEIVSLLVNELGLSNPEAAREEAVDAVERWDEDVESEEPIKPTTPLQHLLSQHYEIAELIMDIRDESIEAQGP
jgi:hypothetical protein